MTEHLGFQQQNLVPVVLTTWLIPDHRMQLKLVMLKLNLSFLYQVDENYLRMRSGATPSYLFLSGK